MQSTPVRLLNTPTEALRSFCQRRPSNDSASVDTTSPLACWPTAMQNDSETHGGPARLVELAASGVATADQPFPCQVWMNVRGVPPRVVPTATQKRSELQDTPARTFAVAASVDVTRHVRPFQISIR